MRKLGKLLFHKLCLQKLWKTYSEKKIENNFPVKLVCKNHKKIIAVENNIIKNSKKKLDVQKFWKY